MNKKSWAWRNAARVLAGEVFGLFAATGKMVSVQFSLVLNWGSNLMPRPQGRTRKEVQKRTDTTFPTFRVSRRQSPKRMPPAFTFVSIFMITPPFDESLGLETAALHTRDQKLGRLTPALIRVLTFMALTSFPRIAQGFAQLWAKAARTRDQLAGLLTPALILVLTFTALTSFPRIVQGFAQLWAKAARTRDQLGGRLMPALILVLTFMALTSFHKNRSALLVGFPRSE